VKEYIGCDARARHSVFVSGARGGTAIISGVRCGVGGFRVPKILICNRDMTIGGESEEEEGRGHTMFCEWFF
jgi:hypothetical protein